MTAKPFTPNPRCWRLIAIPCLLVSEWLLSVEAFAGPPGELEFITQELPWAALARPYSPAALEVRVSGRCPHGGVGFTVVSGSLPPGLKLSSLGYLSGTAEQAGDFEFNIRAVSGCSWTARHFTLAVKDPPKLKVWPAAVAVTLSTAEKLAAAIRLTATWPKLTYNVSLVYIGTYEGEGATGWLTASAREGMTSPSAGPKAEAPGDEIRLRFNTANLKPGQYNAQITVSAWQADPAVVPVMLTVKPANRSPD